MNRINRCLRLCSTLALSGSLALSQPSWSLPEDKQQPIQISADSAELDDGRGTAIYTGNVKLIQGSLELEADTLTLHTDDNGDISLLVAQGQPAHFQQQHQAGAPLTHGYGLTVKFNTLQDLLTLIEQAKLVRGNDSFTGQRIQVDTGNNVIQAFSDQQKPNSRVQMVIQPRKKAAATTLPEAGSSTPPKRGDHSSDASPDSATATNRPSPDTKAAAATHPAQTAVPSSSATNEAPPQ